MCFQYSIEARAENRPAAGIIQNVKKTANQRNHWCADGEYSSQSSQSYEMVTINLKYNINSTAWWREF